MVIYFAFLYVNSIQNENNSTKPTIITFGGLPANNVIPDYNIAINNTSNMTVPIIIPPINIKLKPNEFYIGEIVGIKYFGLFGLVREKIIGTSGYTYEVEWKDNSHGLPRQVFQPWELYRPERGTVPISALQN